MELTGRESLCVGTEEDNGNKGLGLYSARQTPNMHGEFCNAAISSARSCALDSLL
ncbi:MAG: hypothetical protein QOF32_49 [Gammaproteobacteria bacterium]|jgi:hypothetical protein|nr:hypothetical protein [Gammaproteobacteria bacterium]